MGGWSGASALASAPGLMSMRHALQASQWRAGGMCCR